MKLSELNPSIDETDLWIDCPGGCGWKQRVPFKNCHIIWNFSSTNSEDLDKLTVTPSVSIAGHCHFNITSGEIVNHGDIQDSHKNNGLSP